MDWHDPSNVVRRGTGIGWRPFGDDLGFFIDGCREPVGIFLGPAYPEAPGCFKYDPFRGAGHARLDEVLSGGRPAQCWFIHLGHRVNFEVPREHFFLGSPGFSYGWSVEVSRVGDKAND